MAGLLPTTFSTLPGNEQALGCKGKRANPRDWWRAVFAGGKERTFGQSKTSDWRGLAIVLGIAGLLFLTKLDLPLLEPQEPRYAEIARQMLAADRWLTPTLHEQPYLDKPPLFYWLIMVCFRLFGVHDWSARLVPGLAGLTTIFVTYLWGRSLHGPRCGFWGALVLCLSARFVYLERLLTFDCVLCVCVTAALAAAHRAVCVSDLKWRWWLTAGVACGLGLLVKGPVALALVAPPVLVFQLVDGRCCRPSVRAWSALVGIAVLIAGPWYFVVMADQPDFGGYFFWRHNIVRFVAPFDHAEPFWFYWPGLILGMLPWSLLLPGMLVWLYRQSPQTARRRPAALGFWLLASLWAVVFFSLAGCKRAVYILPAMPPLALALGCYLSVNLTGLRRRVPIDCVARVAAPLLLSLAVAIVGFAGWNRWLSGSIVTALAIGLSAALIWWMSGRLSGWVCVAALCAAMLAGGLHLLMPAYHQQFALRDMLDRHASADAGSTVSVFCYPQRWESAGFYLPNARVTAFARGECRELVQELLGHREALVLVKCGRPFEELLQAWPTELEMIATEKAGTVLLAKVRHSCPASLAGEPRQ